MTTMEQAADQQHPLNPQEAANEAAASDADLQKAEAFLRDVAPHLGRLFGMDLSIQVGNGWATNMETGEVTADPRFFAERGYTSDMSVYATLHEVAAHLRELVTEPKLSDEIVKFVKQGSAQGIFHNIFSDIAGNNLIHAVLPKSMPKVAEDLYQEKLFPEVDYSKIPRHLQFLYKIIREEMIPESQTDVRPEVDEAITGLRDYQGKGDLIKYSTAVAKSRREVMRPEEKFRIWKDLIYPVYEKLLEQDKEDPIDSGDSSDGSGESDGQSDSGQQGEQSQEQQPQDGENGQGQFDKYYEDYRENRHPEPLTEEEHEEIHDHARHKPDSSGQQPSQPERPNIRQAQKIIDEQIRRETGGHTLAEQRRYNAEIRRWQNEIAEMRDVFKQVIQERIAQKRGLSRKTFAEGAILDPNRLAQTVVDIKSGMERPEAFRDYEQRRGHIESVGRTDYVFLFDVSGSMAQGGKSQAAASSAVIGLEGLAAMQRDIEEAEQAHNIDLELDIRTAIYTFGEGATLLKPLSNTLNSKERFDTYSAVGSPGDASTYDFLGLEAAQKLKADHERRQIVMVVSDGESHDAGRAKKAIDRLRADGWFVYGISIGSEAAVRLYQPTSKRIDDPSLLPETVRKFIEDTIS